MNNTQGALHFNATIDYQQLKASVAQMRQEIDALSRNTMQRTNEMQSGFKNLAAGIGAYFSAQALGGLVREIINVRGEFQKTEIALATMLKSSTAAKDLMAQMSDLAAKTPFSFQEVSAGAKQLLAFQVPANEVVNTLKRMGDIAAGVGVPLERINMIYGQVKAKGRLQGEELLQFMEAGIPMADELAKVLGVSSSEVSKLASNGQISFEQTKQALFNLTNQGGMFFNMMENTSKSLSGQVSNLGDAWDRMLNDIGKSQEGILSGGIGAITALVENYQTVIDVLTVLVSTYGAYRIAVLLASQAQAGSVTMNAIAGFQNLINVLRGATVAQGTLNAVTMANPYVLLFTAIVAVGSALYVWQKNTSEQVVVQEKLNSLMEKSKKDLSDFKSKTQQYIEVARNDKSLKEDSFKAYMALQKMYPNVLKNIDLEKFKKMELIEIEKLLSKAQNAKEENALVQNIKVAQKEANRLKAIIAEIDDKENIGFFSMTEAKDAEDALKVVNSELGKMEAQYIAIQNAEAMSNMTLQEQQVYLQNQKAELERILEAKDKTKNKLLDINSLSDIGRQIFANWNVNQLQNQLNTVRNDIVSIMSQINNVKPPTANKSFWKKQKEDAEKAIDALVGGKNNPLAAKYIQQIREADRNLKNYDYSEPKKTEIQKEKPKSYKKVEEKYAQGSIKEYQRLLSKVEEERSKTDSRQLQKIAKLNERWLLLKKQMAEAEKAITIKTFDEEMEYMEEQYQLRDQLIQQGVDKAKANALTGLTGKDEKYIDYLKRTRDALAQLNEEGKSSPETAKNLNSINEQIADFYGKEKFIDNVNKRLEELKSKYSGQELIDKLSEEKSKPVLTNDRFVSEKEIQERNNILNKEIRQQEEILEKGFAEMIASHESFEKKISDLKKRHAKNRESQAYLNLNDSDKAAVEDSMAKEISDLTMEAYKASDAWGEVFTDMNVVASRQLIQFRGILEQRLSESKSIEEKIQLGEFIKRINETLQNRNPYITIRNGVKSLGDESLSSEKKLLLLGNAIEAANGYLDDMSGLINDVENVLGNLGISSNNAMVDILSNIRATIEGTKEAMQGFKDFKEEKKIYQEAKEAGDNLGKVMGAIGMVGAAVKIVSGAVKALSGWLSGDNKKERAIKQQAAGIKELETRYNALAFAAERAIGAQKYDGQRDLIKNLEQQKIAIQTMANLEKNKKKADSAKIAEYNAQITGIEQSITKLKEGIIDDVLQTDLKGMAQAFGDALLEAFKKGETGAQALDKVVNNMVQNMLKNQLYKALESQLEPLRKKMLQSMGFNSDGTGSFDGLSEAEIAELKAMAAQAQAQGQQFINSYADIFKDLQDPAQSQGVKGDIKGITEKTAGALEAQINAMRVMVAEILLQKKQDDQTFKQALQVWVQIEMNTRPIKDIHKEIKELNSKVSAGAAGIP